jgi:hypothetical protein
VTTNFARLPLAAALIALLIWPAALVMAADNTPYTPSAYGTPATGISDRSATLHGDVSHLDSYQFEYGLDSSYGETTPTRTEPHHDGGVPGTLHPVSAEISGLRPGTEYHYRVNATGHQETAESDDQTFTTTGSAPTVTSDPTDPPAGTDPPAAIGMPTPKLGASVVVAPVLGTIRIRLPGAARYVTLGAGDDIPVGTVVDTRAGMVKLTSAVDAGNTQSAQFDGAKFEVRQAPTGGGMTDLVLRGANFKDCPGTTGSGEVRAASASKPMRRLWSRDKGGKFRTHGRNSVATVRGTLWSTTDTCAGTRTTVRQGAVSIRDLRRGKTVLVRAGQRYMARSPR